MIPEFLKKLSRKHIIKVLSQKVYTLLHFTLIQLRKKTKRNKNTYNFHCKTLKIFLLLFLMHHEVLTRN